MDCLPSIFYVPEIASKKKYVESRSLEAKKHRVFALIRGIDDLRLFMTWHAFAVWDFMSLVKRLQIEFTSVSIPWIPPKNIASARLINEIVLGEETDLSLGAGHVSHYNLYLDAMKEVGADTFQIETFTDLISARMPISDALKIVNAPLAVRDFVLSTIKLATEGSVEQVLGSFVYGREDAIPEMFQSLLRTWSVDEKVAPIFVYYLQRHIELDSEEHGPAAMQMLVDQVSGDSSRLHELLDAAIDAVDSRIKLWDGLAEELTEQHISRANATEKI